MSSSISSSSSSIEQPLQNRDVLPALLSTPSEQWIREIRVVMTIYNRSVTDSDTPLKISRKIHKKHNLSHSYLVIPKAGIFRQLHGKEFVRQDGVIIPADKKEADGGKPGYILQGGYKRIYKTLNMHQGDAWVRAIVKKTLQFPGMVQYLPICRRCPEINAGYYLRYENSDKKIKELFLSEYCNRGDVAELLISNTFNINVLKKLDLARQMAVGLEYLHANGLVHGDVKLENYLLVCDEKGDYFTRLADVDFLHKVVPDLILDWGSHGWLDPLIYFGTIKGENAFKADVFSLGVCYWMFLYDEKSYFYSSEYIKFYGICSVTREYFEENEFLKEADIKSPLDRLVWEMCDPNPAQRPDMKDVLSRMETITGL